MIMDKDKWKVIEESIAEGASKNVAALLHQPKDLDELLKTRKEQILSEKSTIDVMMKTMLQSHVEGVQLSIGNMSNVIQNIQSMKNNFQGIVKDLKDVKKSSTQFREVREEYSRHSQLAAAVENAKQIFNVAEITEKTRKLIDEGKLLLAHQNIMDLERSRDDIMFEFYKQPSTSQMDQIALEKYFSPVETLSVALGKQIWINIGRLINIIRREPALIVSCLRIIEREERLDVKAMERKQASGFMPTTRPKNWRVKCFQVLEQWITEQVEGSQLSDPKSDKTWLVKHLEIIRQKVLNDLSVVRGAAIPCFPPEYDIMFSFARMYHRCIAKQIADLIQREELSQAEDIVTLLAWLEEYEGPTCLAHPNVSIAVRDLGDSLVAPATVRSLITRYESATSENINNWLARALTVEKHGWMTGQKPDESTPIYQTPTPTDVFQIFDQNINIAAKMGRTIAEAMYGLCLKKLADFSDSLRKAFLEFKTEKFKDRSHLMNYTEVMMAVVNDCSRYIDFVQLWAQKKNTAAHNDKVEECYRCFEHVRAEAINCLLEEPMQDTQQYVVEFFTLKWFRSRSEAMQTIEITLRDYGLDYKAHLMRPNYLEAMETAQLKILRLYIQAILDHKLKMKNADERIQAAERIRTDIEILARINVDLSFVNETGGNPVAEPASDKTDLGLSYDIFANYCELLKCSEDMIQLELSTFVQKFPDVSNHQLARLLDVRGDLRIDLGDLTKHDGQKILDVMSEDLGRKRTRTIFSDVYYR